MACRQPTESSLQSKPISKCSLCIKWWALTKQTFGGRSCRRYQTAKMSDFRLNCLHSTTQVNTVRLAHLKFDVFQLKFWILSGNLTHTKTRAKTHSMFSSTSAHMFIKIYNLNFPNKRWKWVVKWHLEVHFELNQAYFCCKPLLAAVKNEVRLHVSRLIIQGFITESNTFQIKIVSCIDI